MIISPEISESFYASDRLNQAQLNWLRNHGVSTHAMTEPDPIFTARVTFTKTGTFDIVTAEEEGHTALLILAYGLRGEVLDIAAWTPRSGKLATWLGRVCVLGENEILQPCLGAPLQVYREPLAWLKADRHGVVVVNAKRAADVLSGISLQAEDASHAMELRRLLTRPAPQISWPAKVKLEAAE